MCQACMHASFNKGCSMQEQFWVQFQYHSSISVSFDDVHTPTCEKSLKDSCIYRIFSRPMFCERLYTCILIGGFRFTALNHRNMHYISIILYLPITLPLSTWTVCIRGNDASKVRMCNGLNLFRFETRFILLFPVADTCISRWNRGET